MSCVLTSGRIEPCKDNIGGVKNIYVFKYFDYLQSQIVLDGQLLISFPESIVYKYEVKNGSFEQSINNDENGVSYSQSLSFTLFKQDLLTTNELKVLTDIDFRCVVELYDGTFRVLGLYNACKIEGLTIVSGGAKTDLNGYNVTITALEELESVYINSLTVITGETNNYIFMDADNFIFMDGNNYIFQ